MKQLIYFRVLFLKLVMKLIDFIRLLGRQMSLTFVTHKIKGRYFVSSGCSCNLITNVLKMKVNILMQAKFGI
jgi:hypothetical protein